MSDNKVKFLKEFKGGSMARTFLIKKKDKKRVRKIANTNYGLAGDKLKSQYDWIAMFNRIFPDILPNVGLYVIDQEKQESYYDMEYIEMGTLRDYFLNTDQYDQTIIHDILNIGAIIANKDLKHEEDKSVYIKNKHLNKMVERCSTLGESPMLKTDYININGKKVKNLILLIEEIEKDSELMELLTPKYWYRSHGDFTLQNILTDEVDVRVIDPRGEGPDSIYYDISKLFQSCRGKYDLLYEGNYEVKVFSDKEFTNIKVDFNIKKNVEKFDNILSIIEELIPEYYDVEENWELITKFFEASHFISMVPFRAKEGQQAVIICYCIGILLLNEVLEEWKGIKNNEY